MNDHDLATPPVAVDPSPYELVDEARATVLRHAELIRADAERLVERSLDIFTFDPEAVTHDLGCIERGLSCVRAALAVFAPGSDR